jgi:2-dehydropantoate 2-reductase
VPFNGLGVAGCAGFEAVMQGHAPGPAPAGPCLAANMLISDARWLRLVRQLMAEVIAAARALGFAISDSIIEDRIEKTRNMGEYKASTLVDFEQGRPLEVESLFLEPLRRAQSAGVDTPRLAALCRVLAQLDSRSTSATGAAELPGPLTGK